MSGIMIINNQVYGGFYDNENDILVYIEIALSRCHPYEIPNVYEIRDNVADVMCEHLEKKFCYFRGVPLNIGSIENMLEVILDAYKISYMDDDGVNKNSCQEFLFEGWYD